MKQPNVWVPNAFSEWRAANRRFLFARQSIHFYTSTCPALRVVEMLESGPVILQRRLDRTLDSLPVYCRHIWRFTFHSISSTGPDLTRLQLFSRTFEYSSCGRSGRSKVAQKILVAALSLWEWLRLLLFFALLAATRIQLLFEEWKPFVVCCINFLPADTPPPPTPTHTVQWAHTQAMFFLNLYTHTYCPLF